MPNNKHAFVVRIWREPAALPGHAEVWRGSIDDVGGGVRSYFSSLDEISELIRRKLDTGSAEPDGSPGQLRNQV